MKQMLRRDLRLFVRELGLCLAVLALLSALTVGAIFAARLRPDAAPVADVVLCDEDGGLLSRMAVHLVLQQEFAGRTLSVQRAGRDEGLELLRAGRCHGVIVLPEGYLDGLMTGQPVELEIYLSAAAERESALVERLAALGRLLLTAGQYGVFAGEQLIREADLPEQVHTDYLEAVNAALLREALSAYADYFTVEVLPVNDLGPAQRSFLALLGFALFLLPACFTGLYKRDRESDVYPRLRSLGVGFWGFYCGKLLYPALLDLAVCALALGLARPLFAPGPGLIALLLGAAAALSLLSSGLCLLLRRGRGLPTAALLGAAAAMTALL